MPWTKVVDASHYCAKPNLDYYKEFGEGSVWECGICAKEYAIEYEYTFGGDIIRCWGAA